ncbi:hypothetical protein HS7_01610 [Sulfolobales archaeon HS-7]|nr:hypothetical protein HS7_01610 [Sulfolobales archaeon HS-7]
MYRNTREVKIMYSGTKTSVVGSTPILELERKSSGSDSITKKMRATAVISPTT